MNRQERRQGGRPRKVLAIGSFEPTAALERLTSCRCVAVAYIDNVMGLVVEQMHTAGCPRLAEFKREAGE